MALALLAPVPLNTEHRLSDFNCGESSLNDWLKRRALANQHNGASRTFVVTDRLGKFTVTMPWPQVLFRTTWRAIQLSAICPTPFLSWCLEGLPLTFVLKELS